MSPKTLDEQHSMRGIGDCTSGEVLHSGEMWHHLLEELSGVQNPDRDLGTTTCTKQLKVRLENTDPRFCFTILSFKRLPCLHLSVSISRPVYFAVGYLVHKPGVDSRQLEALFLSLVHALLSSIVEADNFGARIREVKASSHLFGSFPFDSLLIRSLRSLCLPLSLHTVYQPMELKHLVPLHPVMALPTMIPKINQWRTFVQ